MAASEYRNDPFVKKNINAYVDDPDDGIKELDRLITHHINAITSLPKDREHLKDIRELVREYVTMFPLFHTREDKVVEVWGQLWGYRCDHGRRGELLWEMKIIWDSDLYSVGLGKSQIRPHFGYEIYFRDLKGATPEKLKRVAGPGHVYFTKDLASLYGRDGKEMHEISKGIYADAGLVSGRLSSNGLLIDRAMRLWTLGIDREAMEYVGKGNLQGYNEEIHRPPNGWGRFEKPSFGRPKVREE